MNNAAQHTDVSTDSCFTQSDWEFALDLIVNPSNQDLKNHLANVPDSEKDGATALFLRKHLGS